MSPLSRLIRVVVISIIDPHLGESVRVAQNDRAGLRGYVQFNKYTHTHTHISIIDPPSGGSMRVA